MEVSKWKQQRNCMMKRTQLAVLLLLTQTSFAEISPSHAEDLEEGTSYPYPFFYDDTDSFSDEDTSGLESKADTSKGESPTAWHGTVGKAKVTVDVENTDFLSQCQAKWDSMQKKNEPEKKKRSRFKDDEDEEEKEDHSPRVSASIKWSTGN
jgi:hypothetical protein